jgi:hypothetical protein
MLLGGPQNTIKSHLVFTALFCFAPFSVFSSRMSAPYLIVRVSNPFLIFGIWIRIGFEYRLAKDLDSSES